MTRPRRPRRVTAEEIAVPQWNLVDDFFEGMGRAGADLVSYRPAHPLEPPRPARDWRALHPAPQAPEPPVLRHLYIYPRISGEAPWGCCYGSPMGEGSEDTAVPAVDPAEARLSPEELKLTPGEPDTVADVAKLQEERRHPRPA
ncbi:hypothetical protein ACNTMW_19985 [Planosporangium sp. 12N6]|uniref:hypothetical protein n=1 Tax=Planosporangium spinosum TaxID=3402278 RepID=UPI003CF9099D